MSAAALRAAGALVARLVPARAVCTWAGVSALPAVPRALAGREPRADEPPGALAAWLLVGGAAVARERARRALGAAWAPLVEAGLLAVVGDEVRATASVVGLGAGVLVCDRLDAGPGAAAPWPDDSSLHLLGALPAGPIDGWLDVGTGAAVAPLAIGGRAARVRGTDVSPAALARAAQGAALSGADTLSLATAALCAGAGPGWSLVSFNAPVPAEHGTEAADASGWRRAPPGADLLARFWREVVACVTDHGEVVVHSAIADDPWAMHGDVGGAWTIARYTPPGVPGFAVTRWQPGAPAARRLVDVALDRAAPFVRRVDLL